MKLKSRPVLHAFRASSIATLAAALSFSCGLSCAHAFDGFSGSVDPFANNPAATPAPTLAPATGAPGPNGTTIYNAGQQVTSRKRGICENHLSAGDFTALAPGVGWYYNWGAKGGDVPPGGVKMEFIPMAWGKPEQVGELAAYLGGHKPSVVFAINEPNLRGQAFINPEATVEYYKKVKAVADAHGIPVVGPHLALGSGGNDSIKAKDPTGKDVVYNWFGSFLQDFLIFAKKANVQTGGVGVHSYKDMGELTWAVNKGYELAGNKPVWVTEFAYWDAPGDAGEMEYLTKAVNMLEENPKVAGYAWFKERVGKNPKLSLLGKDGELTPLGQAYVTLPSHSHTAYYRIPGRIEAGQYATEENMFIRATADADGNWDMTPTASTGTLDYNLQVDVAGSYTLKFRVMNRPGKIEVLENGQVLASVDSTQSPWQTVEATVQLPAGEQTLTVRCNGQTLHWVEFAMN